MKIWGEKEVWMKQVEGWNPRLRNIFRDENLDSRNNFNDGIQNDGSVFGNGIKKKRNVKI